ncbi:MAG: hypothetical protein AB7V48_01825 [Sedimentibacter sp.]
MGLRDGVTKNTGKFPEFRDKEFVNRNLKFVEIQIDIINNPATGKVMFVYCKIKMYKVASVKCKKLQLQNP